MLLTSLATFCCGIASHSSTSICFKSANMVLWVTLAYTTDQADPTHLTVCSEMRLWYLWEHFACKALAGSLRFLSEARVRNRSSWGVVFLGQPLRGLSLTSPVSRNFVLSLEMVPGLTPNAAATLYPGTPASNSPIARALYWSDRHGIFSPVLLLLGSYTKAICRTYVQVPGTHLWVARTCLFEVKTRVNSNRKKNAVDFVKIIWSASHMFSIVSHSTNAGSLHAVPHCKGDKSMIKVVYNTIPFGFIIGEI